MFPKIERPCPYKDNLAAMMDGDVCRACQRTVFDLSALDEGGKRAFLAGCGTTEVCVSYRIPRPAIAAAALAAAAVATPAYAQDVAAAAPAEVAYENPEMMIVVGGIHDPSQAKFVSAEEVTAPALPVTYEDEPEAPAAKETPDVSQN